MAATAPNVTTARGWRTPKFGGEENLQLVDIPLPPLKAGDVLIKVLSADVSYADHVVIRGGMPGIKGLPLTAGCDAVGVITEAGAAVTTLTVGDRVAFIPMFGCLATYAVLPASMCVKIRVDVDADKAVSAVMTGITSYHLLHVLGAAQLTKPAVKILIHSCVGGTGAALVELAKLAGVQTANIYGTCSAKNIAVATAAGVTAFDYALTGQNAWDARVMATTNGAGVDLVFDGITLGGYYARGVAVVARGGRYIAYGFTNSASPGVVSVPGLLSVLLRIGLQNGLSYWFTGRSATLFFGVNIAKPDTYAGYIHTVLDNIAAGRLAAPIGRVWTLEGAQDALAAIGKGKTVGKQVVHVADA